LNSSLKRLLREREQARHKGEARWRWRAEGLDNFAVAACWCSLSQR
jgi:hypothetical protein